MVNQKKGQAAMEFLMTYGWAILVVLIVIGALASESSTRSSSFRGNASSRRASCVQITRSPQVRRN